MNSLIEALNLWGERFLQFAGPMLWQSSLLIVVVFALDFAFRRKIRAAVRYMLWLVVLVKLLLPPTLALPTGLAWWLRQSPPPENHPTRQFIVTYGTTMPMPAQPVASLPAFIPPPLPAPTLSPAGWAIAISTVTSIGLLAWMILRWRQVFRDVKTASPAPESLLELLAETKRSLKMRRAVRLRLTDRPMSPAVCGLFRATILLPRSLVTQLSANQLRAVLLHELIHLKRGDVWVNCAQALLQIFYWWNPLLWFANTRIRRVREETVDDAVMLALRDEAEAYAPTLLEVARLAFNRPLASLGLVGILESRSALRQRIERLMDFHPPRTARVTLASLLCVLAFGALAVPQGGAPATPTQPDANVETPANPLPAETAIPSAITGNLTKSNSPSLIKPGEARFPVTNTTAATTPMPVPDATASPTNQLYVRTFSVDPNTFYQGLESVTGMKLPTVALPSPATKRSASGGLRFVSLTNDMGKVATAVREYFLTLGMDLNPASGKSIFWKDRSGLLLVRATAQDLDIIEAAIQKLSVAKQLPENTQGPATHQPPPPDKSEASGNSGDQKLYVRTFNVNPNTFYKGLESVVDFPVTGTNITTTLRKFLTTLGVELDSPKTIYWNDRAGQLLVRATLQDLDMIEAAIQMLNRAQPQINIRAMFVEITEDDTRAISPDWYLGSLSATNNAGNAVQTSQTNSPGVIAGSKPGFNAPDAEKPLAKLTGILTEPQFRLVRRALEQRKGVDILSAPEVTTVSGRQAQVHVVDLRTIRTGINPQALIKPGITATSSATNSVFQSQLLPFGPVLDVIPYVSADGYTIQMTVTSTMNEFLGYDSPTNFVTLYKNGVGEKTPLPLPRFRNRSVTTSAIVWDGQTLVLGGLMSEDVTTTKDKVPVLGSIPLVGSAFRSEKTQTRRKNLIIFVTPTIIDPAGNRLHTEEEMPFAKKAIPAQSPALQIKPVPPK